VPIGEEDPHPGGWRIRKSISARTKIMDADTFEMLRSTVHRFVEERLIPGA
jgi:hypothetical protein